MTATPGPDCAGTRDDADTGGATGPADTGGATTVDVAAALAVLGLLANSELAAVTRLAADAEVAPSVQDRIALCRLVGAAADRLARVEARAGELGADLADVVAPFLGTFTDFDARTPPGTWWERLLKAHVGFGVADDVARLLARGLDGDAGTGADTGDGADATGDAATCALVLAAVEDDRHAALVVAWVTEATATDPVLASRLALWGRRLVGEALGVVQRLVTDHPELRAVLERVLRDGAEDQPLQQRLFAVLTAEHTRRMDRLGLTA
jgi:hypothetical protein